MIKRFLSLSVERRAVIVQWLYERYVLKPLADQAGVDRITQELYVEFTPDPELEATAEMLITDPVVH